MKSISIKSNLYSNRFFVIYRVLPENRKKAWNENPWDVGTMGMEGGGGNDRRRQGGKERKERRTRTLCIFNAIMNASGQEYRTGGGGGMQFFSAQKNDWTWALLSGPRFHESWNYQKYSAPRRNGSKKTFIALTTMKY